MNKYLHQQFHPIFKVFLTAVFLWFIPVLSRAQTGGWIPIAPSNTPKWVGHSVLVNNKMYVFSGFDQYTVHTTEKCEVYDPQANQWTYLADMPVPVTHAGAAVDGDKVYIAGGFTGSSANSSLLQIYNTATNSWSTGPALPTPSGGNAMVRVGRKLHSFGGTKEDRQSGATTHFVLDLAAPEKGWIAAAPMPEARCHFAAATVAGKIYAMGGQVGHDGIIADVKFVHVYEPATDTWSRLNDMPYVRSHSETGTFVLDGKITLMGGRSGGENILNTVTSYDPATDTWTEQAPLPVSIFGPSAEAIGNELIVSNGSHETRNSPKTNAYKRSIVRTPQYTLGFAPGQLKLSAALGTAVSKNALLWSLSGSPAYNLVLGGLPAWLRVSPASGTVDGNGGTEINITADAAGLPVGSYSATVTAQASGYPDAQMVVELTVTQRQPQVLYLYGSIPPGIHDMKLSDTGARGMSQFRTAIEEVGFTLTESLDAQITLNAATLAPYKVLILGSNNRRFTEAERLAVDSWVKAGGGLVAWSDAAFGWQNGGVSSTAGSVSDNDLTQQFGMQFMRDNGVPAFTLKQWTGNHYINRFNKDAGLTIEAEGASPIRTTAPATVIAYLPAVANKLNSLDGTITAADAALSVAKVGQGRVLGVFDRNAFWNAGEGTWLSRADNKVYAQRLLLWASGVDDTKPATSPVVASPVADFTVLKNSAPTTLDLSQVFSDNGGAANLTLTVSSNTNSAIVNTSLQNTTLTLTYTPDAVGEAEITIRAADSEGLLEIEKFVVTVSATAPRPAETAVHRINAGGPGLTSSWGTFAADGYFNGGYTFTKTNISIVGTDDDALYLTERSSTTNNGSFGYSLPVANGQYKVVLHFADLYWGSPGKRVFDVKAEGALVLDNYDIVRKVGANFTATTETILVNVADGNLDLVFSALASEGGVDRPKVSAIEILVPNESNVLPAAQAGADQTITLPASSVTLAGTGTDTDGSISSYTWSQVSGPATASFSSTSAANPTVGNLVAGTYTFSLVVKDNQNGVSVPDQVQVTVHPDPNAPVEMVVHRINAGGSQLNNSIGTFAADINFNGGYTYTKTNAIAGTQDDAMYQTERSSTTVNGSFGYSLPVANGQYKVVLHFADLYWSTPGKRVFDVQAEGALVLDNYDIVKMAGANFTATTETFPVEVADGSLDLVFSALASEGGMDRPKVSAIEVILSDNAFPTAQAGADQAITLPTSSITLAGAGTDTDGSISSYTWHQESGPAAASFSSTSAANPTVSNLVAGSYTFSLVVKDNQNGVSAADQVVVTVHPDPVVHRINAGGGQQTNSLGTFAADNNFAPAPGYTFTSAKPIAGTDHDALYQTERASAADNGSFNYALPVSNGQYQVVLHFAELYWHAVGQRVFDVKAEGKLVLDNYDIVKKAGANFTATTETIPVNVTDGTLNLLFSASASEGGVNRPKVSAIEVISVTGTNQFPVAQAGADQTITLPASSITLAGAGADTDGSISSYTWSQVSGPAAASFSSTSAASPTVSSLVVGSYTFSLVVQDNQNGVSAADEVVVTVNPDPAALAQASHRLNAGGTQVTTSLGTFAADNYFAPAPGYTYTSANPIAGTQDDALYQTERISLTDNGSFSYALPVSNGQYQVVLHFAELYWNAVGKRVFDVTMEGGLVLDNYDIVKKAGASFTATTETVTVNVTDGTLNILFSALAGEGGVDRPKVSAIEILAPANGNLLPTAQAGADQAITLPASSITLAGTGTDTDGSISSYTWSQVSGPAAASFSSTSAANPTVGSLVAGSYTFSLVVKDNQNGLSMADQVVVTVHPEPVAVAQALHRINAGGGQQTTSLGTFAADTHFSGGISYSTATPIGGTQHEALYQTERASAADNGSFSYALPVSNGQYQVVLHFAELYWNAVGQRVFDVKAEGALVLDNYDIVKKMGGNFIATTETIKVEVADGSLDLVFSALASEGGVNRPKVSAIEVISVTGINQLPAAQAGADQTITLPTSSITLAGTGTDTDGSISSYTWSQVSGPAAASFSSTSAASPTVSSLVAGTYTFSLVVKDDKQALSEADQMTVTVDPDPAAVAQASYRINAGGKQATTSLGTFAADNSFAPAPGYTYTSANPIAGTQNDVLYQTERASAADNGSFSYALPVSNGQYQVVLHFAELYWNAVGQRVFDVKAEGALVLDNYDIVKKAGANFTATTETVTVNVTDGTLDLVFSALAGEGGVDRPKVSAIEILAPAPAPQITSFTLVNALNEQDLLTLESGAAINLAMLPSQSLNIRANTNAAVGSVKFNLSGAFSKSILEGGVVYSLFGDDNGNYYPWTPTAGLYTLTATPYSEANGGGTAGTPLTITFQVIDQAPAARMAMPVMESPRLASVVTAYPNPTADGRFRVALPQAVEGELTYELTTVTGVRVAKGALHFAHPETTLELDFSRQMSATGMYYLRLEGKNGKHQLRVVRQ